MVSQAASPRPEATAAEQGEQPKRQVRKLDAELQAMASIDRLMAGLDPRSTQLVRHWLWDKYAPRVPDEDEFVEKPPF